MTIKKKHTKGNVLFLILIAVALFAALSYAVTSSSKGGGNRITKDKAKIVSAQIVQYATEMEQAISRMMLINKVQEHAFDVSDFSVHSTSAANTACVNDLCKLFLSNGGAVPAQFLPKKAWDMDNTNMTVGWQGKMWFRAIRVQDVGSDLPDLMLLYPGLSDEVCAQINKSLNIANDPDGSPPLDSASGAFVNYAGNLTAFPAPVGIGLGDTATQIVGQRTFCVKNNLTANFFYHVLMAR